MAPYRLILPKVGFRPVTPHASQGEIMEPADSVPIENPTQPAAVAEPGPADEPPDPHCGFHGFLVIPLNQRSPDANVPVASLATRTAPAPSSFSTTEASRSMIRSLYGSAPQVV